MRRGVGTNLRSISSLEVRVRVRRFLVEADMTAGFGRVGLGLLLLGRGWVWLVAGGVDDIEMLSSGLSRMVSWYRGMAVRLQGEVVLVGW
jgi:hypothetical protein